LAAETLVNASGVNAFYGKSHVLHNLDLQIEAGRIVGLLGRNGVGKSTTLKTIIGLVNPLSGSITFKGRRVDGLRPYQIARMGIGYVPEERRIFPDLSVRENLIMGMKTKDRGSVEGGWDIERVYAMFPGLKSRDRIRGGYLSGGEQQMLSIGRTLMGNPELLLLDEPTEGLAPQIVEKLIEVIQEIHRSGVTILLVEQKTDVIMQLAQSVWVMSKGEIVFRGTAADFLTRPDIQKAYLECGGVNSICVEA
jgi:branched-chain amino acid transport system ATP-binding protein